MASARRAFRASSSRRSSKRRARSAVTRLAMRRSSAWARSAAATVAHLLCRASVGGSARPMAARHRAPTKTPNGRGRGGRQRRRERRRGRTQRGEVLEGMRQPRLGLRDGRASSPKRRDPGRRGRAGRSSSSTQVRHRRLVPSQRQIEHRGVVCSIPHPGDGPRPRAPRGVTGSGSLLGSRGGRQGKEKEDFRCPVNFFAKPPGPGVTIRAF